MSATARRLIEAIQHSLVGSLLVHLLWPWGVFTAAFLSRETRGGPWADEAAIVLGSIVGITLTLVFLAWLLGALARSAYAGDAARAPANGFETWKPLPPGGLRPPAPLRSLVRAAGPDRRRVDAALVATVAAWIVMLAVAFVPDRLLSFLIVLESPHSRVILLLALWAAITFSTVRWWAQSRYAELAPA